MGKKVRIGPSFISAAKDVVGCSNGYSGNFGDEGASVLWFDGKGVAHFKESENDNDKETYIMRHTYIPRARRRITCSTSKQNTITLINI